jgi:hypothetical protein
MTGNLLSEDIRDTQDIQVVRVEANKVHAVQKVTPHWGTLVSQARRAYLLVEAKNQQLYSHIKGKSVRKGIQAYSRWGIPVRVDNKAQACGVSLAQLAKEANPHQNSTMP